MPLRNPFVGFGAMTTGTLMRPPPGEAMRALPQLIVTIRRSKTLGKSTLQALPTAEKATRAMDQAVTRINELRTAVHNAHATRDAVAQIWEAALGALKRGARAAADDGAPTLYATLLERPSRTNGKNHKSVPPAAPQPSVTPSPNPPPPPEPAAS